jgi:hypothetical protein
MRSSIIARGHRQREERAERDCGNDAVEPRGCIVPSAKACPFVAARRDDERREPGKRAPRQQE